MALVRCDPFRQLNTFESQVNRIFGVPGLDWSERLPADNTAWTPKVDIFETETNLVLKAELPGVDAKNVALSLEKDVLTLKGERRFENEDQKTIITVSSVPTAHSRGPSRYPRRSRRPKSMPTTKTASSR